MWFCFRSLAHLMPIHGGNTGWSSQPENCSLEARMQKTDWHYYNKTILICFSVMCAKVYVNLYVLNHSSQCESCFVFVFLFFTHTISHSLLLSPTIPVRLIAHAQCLFASSRFYRSNFTFIALVFYRFSNFLNFQLISYTHTRADVVCFLFSPRDLHLNFYMVY